MKHYRLLILIERVRYGLIVVLFQIPALIMLVYVLIKTILIYLANPDIFGIIYIQTIQRFSNNLPLPFIIWFIAFLTLQLFLKHSLLSIKGQYFTHREHLFLIWLKKYHDEELAIIMKNVFRKKE